MPYYLDFFPVEHQLGGQVWTPGGAVFTQWATGGFNDYYGTPAQFAAGQATPELFGTEVVDGRAYLTLLGFQQVEPPHNIWDLRTLKANIYIGGVKKPMSLPKRGHVYVPLTFEPCSIEIWGIIEEQNQFYWRAWYTGPAKTANVLRNEVVDGITQQEVWWDRTGGWIRGGPTPTTALPFDSKGNPQDINTTSGWFQVIGKERGPCYLIGDAPPGQPLVPSAMLMHLWKW